MRVAYFDSKSGAGVRVRRKRKVEERLCERRRRLSDGDVALVKKHIKHVMIQTKHS